MLNSTVAIVMMSTIALALNDLNIRQSCGQMYELCSPQGVTVSKLPPVGSRLGGLYSDLVQAVSGEISTSLNPPSRGWASDVDQEEGAFCCEKISTVTFVLLSSGLGAQTSQCLLLPDYDIPFCWDRFTTNFYFPDGSYGTLVTGNYTSALAVEVNLIYGDWRSQDGSTGNIYSNSPSSMPDTSTMPMPTPWTSSGIGSAIPASELGSSTTLNMTPTNSPSTTISAITLLSTTITIGTSECHHCNFTIIPITDSGSMTATTNTSGSSGGGNPSASKSIYTVTTLFPPINMAAPAVTPLCSYLFIIFVDIIAYLFSD